MANLGLFQTVAACRQYFMNLKFIETPTPPLVPHPGMETHLHPFQIKSVCENESLPLYLHTSPEFEMKVLLSQGLSKIYHLGYCFRDEPDSETHRAQFLMLEWYRAGAHYHQILEDTLQLIEFTRKSLEDNQFKVYSHLKLRKYTVTQLFDEFVGISILDHLEPLSLATKIVETHPHLLSDLDEDNLWPWEDYFFLLFLNLIEPQFKRGEIVVVDEFPAPLAALSTLHPENPKVCQRFEIYLSGVELCNCFNELTDLETQRRRFQEEEKKKKELYQYSLGEPTRLYQALEKGLPPSSGIALGVERLYLGLINEEINPFFI